LPEVVRARREAVQNLLEVDELAHAVV